MARTTARHASETARLEALSRTGLLDSPADEAFDAIVRVAQLVTRTPIALVSLLDEARQWFKARSGLDVEETPREWAFCSHALEPGVPLVVPDTHLDPRFRDNPLVLGEPFARFYAGIPLQSSNGYVLGTLCVLDRKPRKLTDRQLDALRDLARQVERQIALHQRVMEAEAEPNRGSSGVFARRNDEVAVEYHLQLTPQLTVSEIDAHILDLIGYSAAEIVSRPELIDEIVHADDRAVLALTRAQPRAFARPLPLRWRHRDGRWIWVERSISNVVERDGVVFAFDVRVRALAPPLGTDDVADTEGGLRDRLESHGIPEAGWRREPHLLAVLDATGVVRFQSATATDVLGYDAASQVGQNGLALVHPDDQPRVRRLLEHVSRAPEAVAFATYRYRHADDSWVLLESHATNLLEDPHVRGIVIHSRVLNASSEGEQRLAASREALAHDLSRVERDRAELVSLVVHDLKNPLAVILANADFLTMCELPATEHSACVDIVDASLRLERMILDMLDVSRAENGRLTPQRRAIDLVDLARATERRSALRARERGVRVRVTATPGTASVDPEMLERILDNLIDNALKYGPGEEVRVELENTADALEGAVRDLGPGVPIGERSQIFDKYVRRARHEARTSRGLGLVFCRLAAEAHGGSIWVEDNEPRGACFRFRLPVADDG